MLPSASIDIQATSKFLLSAHYLFAMEKPSTMLIEQLQSVHARQRKVIQQLQADNARLLSDLVEIRRERDAFRAEAAKLRKEQAELHNQLDETLSEYQDLRRERLTLSRAFSNASSFGRPSKANNKVSLSGHSDYAALSHSIRRYISYQRWQEMRRKAQLLIIAQSVVESLPSKHDFIAFRRG